MNIDNFKKCIEKDNCALLCGNGFSINFDEGYSDIYDRLFITHKLIYNTTHYNVKGNAAFIKKLKENYRVILKKLKYISKEDFYRIFNDGIAFAKSIVEHPNIEKELRSQELIKDLVYNISQWTSVCTLYQTGTKYGAKFVNIEYWPILTYFYFAIKRAKINSYEYPKNNLFIELVKIGNTSPIILKTGDNIEQYVLFNGFNIYYKMLFSLAIYNNGKAVCDIDLDKEYKLDIIKIKSFLKFFHTIFSLNYDLIIEKKFNMQVIHLHGQFREDEKYFYYNQSYSIEKSGKYINCSDILIGDYFINKLMLSIIAKLASSNQPYNKKHITAVNAIEQHIIDKNINRIIVFGMNISNDQDILRYIMLAYHSAKTKKPNITYCYFNEEEKEEFQKQFYNVITFSKEVSDYARKISIDFISTQSIIKEIFERNT